MVLVWVDMGGSGQPSVGSSHGLEQIVSVPVWILLLVGNKYSMQIEVVLRSTFLYLVLPLIFGALTRRVVVRRKARSGLSRVSVPVLGENANWLHFCQLWL